MLSSSADFLVHLSAAVRDAARQAGALALPHFRAGEQTAARLWYKGQSSLGQSSPVTEADIALDTFLKEHLTGLFPEAGWLSEETADDPARLERSHVWVVDPIDGTRAFASGHPDWAISIALVKDGMPVLGVLHAPIHEQTYEAILGGGAWRNGQRLRLSGTAAPTPARVAGPKPLVDRFERNAGPVEHLFRFEFPERPGALVRFLDHLQPDWNVSLFHYRNHGADTGRILVGLQVPPDEQHLLPEFLARLGYPYRDESAHPAYRLLLGQHNDAPSPRDPQDVRG